MSGGDQPGLQGLTVMLVDDHRDAATALARLLEEFGCAAEVCFDGNTALQRVPSLRPDVVILDVRLPDIPGTEVCRRLRALDALAGMSLFALTGAADDATLAEVHRAGFDRTLTKPVDLASMLEALASAAKG